MNVGCDKVCKDTTTEVNRKQSCAKKQKIICNVNWAELIKEIIIICCKVVVSESLILPQGRESAFRRKLSGECWNSASSHGCSEERLLEAERSVS